MVWRVDSIAPTDGRSPGSHEIHLHTDMVE